MSVNINEIKENAIPALLRIFENIERIKEKAYINYADFETNAEESVFGKAENLVANAIRNKNVYQSTENFFNKIENSATKINVLEEKAAERNIGRQTIKQNISEAKISYMPIAQNADKKFDYSVIEKNENLYRKTQSGFVSEKAYNFNIKNVKEPFINKGFDVGKGAFSAPYYPQSGRDIKPYYFEKSSENTRLRKPSAIEKNSANSFKISDKANESKMLNRYYFEQNLWETEKAATKGLTETGFLEKIYGVDTVFNDRNAEILKYALYETPNLKTALSNESLQKNFNTDITVNLTMNERQEEKEDVIEKLRVGLEEAIYAAYAQI